MGNINLMMKEYISPINTIQEAIFIICLKLCFDQEISIIKNFTNLTFGSVYNDEMIKCALSKYLFLMNDFAAKIEKAKLFVKSLVKNVDTVSHCIRCSNVVSFKDKKTIPTYSYDGVTSINYAIRSCLPCSIDYFTDYYLIKNNKYFYCYKINNDLQYLLTSKETSFEIKLLKWYDINLVRNSLSLSGFSDAYNDMFFSNSNKVKNILFFQIFIFIKNFLN
jgi:hypothetical protein